MPQTTREEMTMTAPGQRLKGAALSVAHAFDIEAAKARLAADGGYEIIHESVGLEIGVYVLVAPEPDHQQPHVDDEVYVVEGRGFHADQPGRLRRQAVSVLRSVE